MIYCAYGSNMNIEQMAFRCPDAKVIGTGIVPDYLLMFRGAKARAYANIQPDRSAVKKYDGVPCVLWYISEKDEKSLDRYEGFPQFYYKDFVNVVTSEGKKVKAMAYIMTPGRSLGVPTEEYFNIILEGYNQNDIDTQYLFERLKFAADHSKVLQE